MNEVAGRDPAKGGLSPLSHPTLESQSERCPSGFAKPCGPNGLWVGTTALRQFWRRGEYWFVALVLKTSPGKAGEGSIPFRLRQFKKILVQ